MQAGLIRENGEKASHILPVSLIQGQYIWQSDLSRTHLKQISQYVMQSYPDAQIDPDCPRWYIPAQSKVDYFDLSSQSLDLEYAKRLVNIELVLYASELNVQREQQGKESVSSIRVIKPIRASRSHRVYANRSDIKAIFNCEDFSAWLASPDLNAYLIFSPEDQNTQMQDIQETILYELENRGFFQVEVHDANHITFYSSRLFSYYVSRAKLLFRRLFEARNIIDHG